ncbi:unnamed protein product [Rotaria sp. Silwood1]|nr:unnamed protein product [Rotaria sp. Silwood1]CAF4895082.1 unnamed protein product [Rotaria sp. Silwood1]
MTKQTERKEINLMNLELFPNEILFDLFDYFDGVDLFHTFYNLNSRFNFLLYQQYRFYSFNFNFISKRNFDLICKQHLSFVTNQILALRISDNANFPRQVNLFISYMSSFSQFTHLQSLSLSYLHSYNILMKIIDECHQLGHLTHLYMKSCYFPKDQGDFLLIINKVWSLLKLTHCYFQINIEEQEFFRIPTTISSSLQCLSVCGSVLKSYQINALIDHTIHLRYLSIPIEFDIYEGYKSSSFLIPTNLNITITYLYNFEKLISFFRHTSNLCRLRITLSFNIIDGHQWEHIIHNYLPKLRVFRFNMSKRLCYDDNIKKQVDELIDSFSSSFWINDHQWFVRCFTQKNTVHLSTLSTTFNYYKDELLDIWKSTYPNDVEQEFYNNLTTINKELFFNQLIPSHIRLPNLRNLWIEFPINDRFWSIVPNLNHLYSLTIFSYINSFQFQLQNFLDQIPHLNRLAIGPDNSLPLQISLFKCTNVSIRQLDLQNYVYGFNEEECIILCQSSLGIQCQVLFIQVRNPQSIIYLIKNMVNLQQLHVQCKFEKNCEHLPKIANGELIQWLKEQLPSTYSIVTHPSLANRFQIFIY